MPAAPPPGSRGGLDAIKAAGVQKAALFGSTALGAPVSTTHTVAGAVSGVGVANRGTGTNWSVFGGVAAAWVITIPFSGVVAALMYQLTVRPPDTVASLAVGLVAVVLVALLIRALLRTPTAGDLEAEAFAPEEQIAVPLRPGTGAVIPGGLAGARQEEGRRSRSVTPL